MKRRFSLTYLCMTDEMFPFKWQDSILLQAASLTNPDRHLITGCVVIVDSCLTKSPWESVCIGTNSSLLLPPTLDWLFYSKILLIFFFCLFCVCLYSSLMVGISRYRPTDIDDSVYNAMSGLMAYFFISCLFKTGKC